MRMVVPASPNPDLEPSVDTLDAWLADDTVVALEEPDSDADSAGDADGVGDHNPDLNDHPWQHLDPVSAWLLRVALVLIIVVLSLAAAMVLFFATTEKAPRTLVERDIAAAEIALRAKSGDASAWQALAYAYAQGERYDDALAAVRRGRRSNKAPALALTEAEVLRAAGRPKEALAVYDEALIELSREESEAVASRIKQGLLVDSVNQDLVRGYYSRSLTRQTLGDTAGAIKDVLRALELSPRQAHMYVTLGDLYAASDQDASATKAYETALRYVPDYGAALLGLKRLKEGE